MLPLMSLNFFRYRHFKNITIIIIIISIIIITVIIVIIDLTTVGEFVQ